ncbi:DUF4013 domain-containing protein [Methanoculleus sp. Afa-1]|uniref:DUF4013 domain-containing protein n=1 Tax=Methanoculleus formosensis TaxID=2590886 RepID=A0A9E4ZNG7_9EURY|nr:DUF4013 domain-containing protein [Methanoculleus sp. Afa-1]MCT8337645.1 DUF4013 domain-containing protein [Methanoculleus sp. Afa-1]
MDYGNLISRAFGYTKEALWGEWGRWLLLVLLSLVQTFTLFLVPLYNGYIVYIVRVLAGRRPAPEVDDWGRLFLDGWKLNIINLIYLIPVIVALAVFGGVAVLSAVAARGLDNPDVWASAVAAAVTGIAIAALVWIVISFVSLLAVVRFAHTGSLLQAFNITAILSQISWIGWGAWIAAVVILILIGLVYTAATALITSLPVLGWIANLFIGVVYGIFRARYLAVAYESAPAPG